MRFKKAVTLLMTLMMAMAAWSIPTMAADTSAEAIEPAASATEPTAEMTGLPSEITDQPLEANSENTGKTASISPPPPHFLLLSYDAEQGSVEVSPNGVYTGGSYWYYPVFGVYPNVDITVTPKEGFLIKSITSWKYLYNAWVPESIDITDPEGSVTLEKNMYCDRKISAKFEKVITYTANALASPANGGTATVNGEASITAAAGVEVVFLAEPNMDDGYYFDGWYRNYGDAPVELTSLKSVSGANGGYSPGDLVSTENPYRHRLEEDITLTAVFKKETSEEITHQLVIETIGEGTASGAGIYQNGEEVTVTATPEEGWDFEGWYAPQPRLELYSLDSAYGDDELVLVTADNPYRFVITEDTLLAAKFVQRVYEVTVDIIGKGTVTGAGAYTHGQYLNLTANPDSGWYFDNWYYGGESFNPGDYPVTTDMAITAKFLKNQKTDNDTRPGSSSSSSTAERYTLQISVLGAGTVQPEPGTHSYSEGTTVALVPVPEPGVLFLGWSGEDAGDIVNNSILMNGNKSIIARFSSRDEERPPAEPEQESIPVEETAIIPDDEIPISSLVLPKTAGIPLELLMAAGSLMVSGGIAIRRKRSKR